MNATTCRTTICKYVLHTRLNARVGDCVCHCDGVLMCRLHHTLRSIVDYAFEKHNQSSPTTSSPDINGWTHDEAMDRVKTLTTASHIAAAVNVLYALITHDHEIYILVSDLLELAIRI